VIGNQVGGGDGRKVATGAGVVGGALLGNEIEKRQRRDDEMYRVEVRFDNGGSAQFDYRRIDDLQVGDRVRVDNGEIYRL
jgi:outer membrane lipoprotein SlyB